MVTDLIRGFVREDWTEGLDFSTLERASAGGVSHDLREREDDIIWRLRWGEGWLYVYLLLEFQSTVDRFMAVRIMTYIGLLYQDLIAADKVPPGEPLPPVLPIVLYNGSQRWWAKTELAALQEPGLPTRLAAWQPRVRYVLLEERAYPDGELAAQHNLVAALFQLENSHTPQDLQRIVAKLVEWLQTPEQSGLRRAFVVWLKRVLLPARIPGTEIPDIIELQEMQTMLAERVKTWTEDWKEQGIQEGIQQGLQQGLQLGEATLLQRLLLRRFGSLPAWVERHLQAADQAQLEGWGDRVLEAESLEDVFGESE